MLMRAIGKATDQHEAPVAIAAFDKALFVNLKPDTWMAQRGGHVTRSIAGDAGGVHTDDVGRIDHALRLAMRNQPV
jgi:hypothetical protein